MEVVKHETFHNSVIDPLFSEQISVSLTHYALVETFQGFLQFYLVKSLVLDFMASAYYHSLCVSRNVP